MESDWYTGYVKRQLLYWYLKRRLHRAPARVQDILRDPGCMLQVARSDRAVLLSDSMLITKVPYVTDYLATQDQTEASRLKVLQIAASMASYGSSPYFLAVKEAAVLQELAVREVEIDATDSHRILGRLDRTWYVFGDRGGMETEGITLGVTSQTLAQQLEAQGKAVYYLAQRQPKRLLGVVACRSEISEDAVRAVESLRSLRLKTELVSSHSERMLEAVFSVIPLFDLIHAEVDAQYVPEIIANYPADRTVFFVSSDLPLTLPDGCLAFRIGSNGKKAGIALAEMAEAVRYAKESVERARRRMLGSGYSAGT